MKNINRYLTYGLIIGLGVVSSCKKDDSKTPEPTISIKIQSPTEGAVLSHGNTLHIVADVSSPVDLHGYEWKIKDKNTGTVINSNEDHAHSREFTITAEYVNNVTDTINAELEITVIVDHDGDESTQKVNITLYP